MVIPTRDRASTLAHTLDALARQDVEPGAAEIVVVDNGSRDGTPELLEQRAPGYPLELRVLHQEKPGASAARNAGLAAAEGEVVLFLGDDTAPADPDLLARHLALHRARPAPTVAILGRVAWAPVLEVTPLMRWLDRGGQFAFAVMTAGPAGPQHFYTAHLSAKTGMLLEAGGFDESLPIYFEDSDLGERLFRRGLELVYHPELLVHHDHAITLPAWLQRQEAAGRSGRRLREARDVDERLVPRPRGWRWRAAAVVAAVAGAPRSEWRRLPAPVRDRLYAAAHYAAYARGYRG